MQPVNPSQPAKISLVSWRIFLMLALLQSVVALSAERGGSWQSGLNFISKPSPTQLLILSGIALALTGFSWLLLQTWIRPARAEQHLEHMAIWLHPRKTWARMLLLIGAIFLGGGSYLTLIPDLNDPLLKGVFERFLPVAIWVTGLCAQTLTFLVYARYGSNLSSLRLKDKPFFLSIAFVGLILLGWRWVTLSTFEQLDDRPGWGNLGDQIIETQLLIAWLAGMLMFFFMILAVKNQERFAWVQSLRPQWIDFSIGILLWLVTALLWQSQPIVRSYYITQPRPPNFEHYPNSDALKYDRTSQSHLVGEGYRNFEVGAFVRRPFLAVLHSLYHLIGGQDYKTFITVQVALLALLPSLIYYLTKTIHHRVSGMTAAVLIMLREASSASTIHAKVLMSDLPTQFLVVCLAISAIAWMKRLDRNSAYPLVSGAFLGLTILIRTEAALLFLPLLAVSGVILLPKKLPGVWLKNALLLALGSTLILFPWLWRTYRLTGYFSIDSPAYYLRLLENRAQLVNPPALEDIEGQIPADDLSIIDMTAVITAAPQGASQTTPTPPANDPGAAFPDKLNAFLPEKLATNVAYGLSHYLNSQVQMFLILPTSVRVFDPFVAYLYHRDLKTLWYECCTFKSYRERMPYWPYWKGDIPSQAIIPLALISIILATGISVAWRRHQLTGLIPLILATSYIGIHALLRNSGARFILPVDWTTLVYFSIGLVSLSASLIGAITDIKAGAFLGVPDSATESLEEQGRLPHSPKFYALIVGIFLLGCALPLFELSIPQRYTPTRIQGMMDTLMVSGNLDGPARQNLQLFLTQGGLTLAGRGLYPRFFPAGSGEVGSGNVFGPKSFPHIGFYLAGPQSQALIMPFERQTFNFPNSADIIVFACKTMDEQSQPEWDVLAIAVFNPTGAFENLLQRFPMPASPSCPLPHEALAPAADN